MKRICCLLLLLAFGVMALTACATAWTDKDIIDAAAVEIICYDNESGEISHTCMITEEREVNNLRHTFSLLAVKKTRRSEPMAGSYTIRFLDGSGNEIESLSLFFGCNVVENDGTLFKITDEMDINRHIGEVVSEYMQN